MTQQTKHIAIVGAGLVGSLLAIYLAKRGYQVSVFERRPDIRIADADGGRSINLALSTRGIAALEEVGVANEIKHAAIPMHGRMMHDENGKRTFLAYGRQGQHINSISRNELNIVLINKAEAYGVKFFFHERCAEVNLNVTTITFQAATSKTFHTRAFDLIIGADGAFSAVRSAMQITDRFDYSQHYLAHGYKEFRIPPGKDGDFALEKNALHIWPRESFMMIALPNPGGDFTCTLFLPFEGAVSFSGMKEEHQISTFFREVFPDARNLMPELLKDYKENPTSSLVTIKCFPWTRNKTLLIGDAAHGIVPFYGQGMNAGFEDCRILNRLLDKHQDDWITVFADFQSTRKEDTDAIAQLAFNNFIEMRDLVADPKFLLRKKIEARLHELFPDKWIPLYSMVTFYENISYAQAYRTGEKQRKIMDEVMERPGIADQWQSLNFKEIVEAL